MKAYKKRNTKYFLESFVSCSKTMVLEHEARFSLIGPFSQTEV